MPEPKMEKDLELQSELLNLQQQLLQEQITAHLKYLEEAKEALKQRMGRASRAIEKPKQSLKQKSKQEQEQEQEQEQFLLPSLFYRLHSLFPEDQRADLEDILERIKDKPKWFIELRRCQYTLELIWANIRKLLDDLYEPRSKSIDQ